VVLGELPFFWGKGACRPFKTPAALAGEPTRRMLSADAI